MTKKRKSKYRIINIRSANGGGKTYLVRKLMKLCNVKPIYGESEPNRLMGSVIGCRGNYENQPIYFVGPYEIMAGGSDALMARLGTLDKVCDIIREFATRGHVVFEGFMISGLFSRFYNLSRELGGITFCYLDTPLDICYKRIDSRNREKTAAQGHIRKSAGVKTVADRFKQVEATRQKFSDIGEEVVVIDYKRPMHMIHKILKNPS